MFISTKIISAPARKPPQSRVFPSQKENLDTEADVLAAAKALPILLYDGANYHHSIGMGD